MYDVADDVPFHYARYPAACGTEWMLVHGPSLPRVLILGPLLNEMNQTRALLVDLARRLAARGIASALPDLPGTGESLVPLCEVRWTDWQQSAAAAADTLSAEHGSLPHIVSLRGGNLLDIACSAASRWRFAAVTGAALLRPLERVQRLAGDGQRAGDLVELGGFAMNAELVAALRAAEPADVAEPVRSLAYERPGLPLWRRAEPGADPELAEQLSSDIASWVTSCER